MARENRLWSWMKDGLSGTPGLHLRRVENMAGTGDPDVEGCWNGRYFDVELKGCDRPAKDGQLNFEVRQSQVIWHRRRRKAGGNVWLYVRVGVGRDIRRYLLPSWRIDHIKEHGVTEQSLAEWAVLPPGHTAREALERVCCGSPPI